MGEVALGVRHETEQGILNTPRVAEDGLIKTDALRDDVLGQFQRRREWARLRWECDVKPSRAS